MLIKVHLVDAFTNIVGQGNRAGVVLDGDALTVPQMQEIARQVGVSETAFVLSPTDNDHEIYVRYFTPTKEVPICGHATIATHFLRAKANKFDAPRTVRSRTDVGVLPVDIEFDKGEAVAVMTQDIPTLSAPFEPSIVHDITRALGISPSALDETLPVQIASTGHSKIMVPLKDKATLDSLKPDFKQLEALSLSPHIKSNGFYTFTLDTQRKDILVAGRMFAPAIGINEDPVTGNANGPAGYYLYKHGRLDASLPVVHYKALQGEAMGKPGYVDVILRLHPGKEPTVQVKGAAVVAGEIIFKIEKDTINRISTNNSSSGFSYGKG